MRISINITNYSWPDGTRTRLAGVVRAADAAGLDTVWVNDHLMQADPTRPDDREMLEAYTTLGYLAGQTERVRLGTMVTGVTYRPPPLLVKAVSTLDVLSGGRAWLGVGTGYHEQEARTMGLPLPPAAQRYERLEETLRLALAMWSGDGPPDHPGPVQKPHPPILVGGMGERRTLPLVARYADACNLFDLPDGGKTLRHKLSVLERRCVEAGRRYADIERTVSTRLTLDESLGSFARRCRAFEDLGITHAVLITDGPWTVEAVERLGAVIPDLRDGRNT